MFSKGQILFAIFFIIAFVALMIFSYRGDAKSHNLHYRGSLKIFLVFLLIIFALFLIKFFTQ